MTEINGWPSIVPVSGWRSRKEQQEIWERSLLEHGLFFTETYVAFPGCSEHETGLAIDLGVRKPDIDFIRPEFPYDGICQIFRSQAPYFGFIERYPAQKEGITGIGHEPWHFRYVGIPHALIMNKHHMVLEEYISFLKRYPHGRNHYEYKENGLDISVSYLQAQNSASTEFETTETMPYCVSGNNTDGFIITEWRINHGQQTKLQRT